MSGSIVILSGAGISAESGLETFRAADGLWCGHKVEEVATFEAFEKNPSLVHDFYNQRRQKLKEVAPNAAHLALARLAENWPQQRNHAKLTIVTQNVDDLHQRALKSVTPAANVQFFAMHGELLKARCTLSHQVCDWPHDIEIDTPSPFAAEGNLRPHIVWFGEMPLFMDEISQALEECSLFVSIGTSGNVYPAAGFVDLAKQNGARTLELNLDPSQRSHRFVESRFGPASLLVPSWVDEILCKA